MTRMGRAMSEFYTGRPVYARPMPRLAWAALAASVLLAGCAPALSFPNATASKPLSVPAYEARPDGRGPFPAVVLMHGCHGVSQATRDWGRWLRDRGYVALIVDSWAARSIKDGCLPGPDIPSTERFDDAVGALRWLHSRPYVDPRRVGAIGWSNGGVFAIALVNGPSLERAKRRGVEMPAPSLRAPAGFYPRGGSLPPPRLVHPPPLDLPGDPHARTPTPAWQPHEGAKRQRR